MSTLTSASSPPRSTAVRLYQSIVPRVLRPRTFAERKLLRVSSGRVLAGPFAGMQYHPLGVGDAWHQRILGTYELEIRGAIESLIGRGFTRVVNVGAADGFYAVGLAMRLPQTRIVAFEMLTEKHELIRRLAKSNEVEDRVEVHARCDVAQLRHAIGDDPSQCLVVMDVEGTEYDLLDPVVVPELTRAAVLVEMHEDLRPGLERELARRFEPSHQIEKIVERPRVAADLPFRSTLLRPWMMSFTLEHRQMRQEWWAMTPRG